MDAVLLIPIVVYVFCCYAPPEQELPFRKVQHQVVTCDCQPTVAAQPNGILVTVSGNLVIDDGANPMKFAQCFHLIPDPASPGNYWVHNDIFRLNLG